VYEHNNKRIFGSSKINLYLCTSLRNKIRKENKIQEKAT